MCELLTIVQERKLVANLPRKMTYKDGLQGRNLVVRYNEMCTNSNLKNKSMLLNVGIHLNTFKNCGKYRYSRRDPGSKCKTSLDIFIALSLAVTARRKTHSDVDLQG